MPLISPQICVARGALYCNQARLLFAGVCVSFKEHVSGELAVLGWRDIQKLTAYVVSCLIYGRGGRCTELQLALV